MITGSGACAVQNDGPARQRLAIAPCHPDWLENAVKATDSVQQQEIENTWVDCPLSWTDQLHFWFGTNGGTGISFAWQSHLKLKVIHIGGTNGKVRPLLFLKKYARKARLRVGVSASLSHSLHRPDYQ